MITQNISRRMMMILTDFKIYIILVYINIYIYIQVYIFKSINMFHSGFAQNFVLVNVVEVKIEISLEIYLRFLIF